MALGSMKISWETCRTGLALGIESSLGGKGENVKLGILCRTRCETGMRPHLQGGFDSLEAHLNRAAVSAREPTSRSGY